MEPSGSPGAEPRYRDLGAVDIGNAQSRFFPSWSSYIGVEQESLPLYRVIVDNKADLELAQAIEPDGVEADYVLVDLGDQPATGSRRRRS